jgi:hypothetical protein
MCACIHAFPSTPAHASAKRAPSCPQRLQTSRVLPQAGDPSRAQGTEGQPPQASAYFRFRRGRPGTATPTVARTPRTRVHPGTARMQGASVRHVRQSAQRRDSAIPASAYMQKCLQVVVTSNTIQAGEVLRLHAQRADWDGVQAGASAARAARCWRRRTHGMGYIGHLSQWCSREARAQRVGTARPLCEGAPGSPRPRPRARAHASRPRKRVIVRTCNGDGGGMPCEGPGPLSHYTRARAAERERASKRQTRGRARCTLHARMARAAQGMRKARHAIQRWLRHQRSHPRTSLANGGRVPGNCAGERTARIRVAKAARGAL